MRTVHASTRKLAVPGELAYLFAVEVPTTPPTRLRLTNYDSSLTFGQPTAGADVSCAAAGLGASAVSSGVFSSAIGG